MKLSFSFDLFFIGIPISSNKAKYFLLGAQTQNYSANTTYIFTGFLFECSFSFPLFLSFSLNSFCLQVAVGGKSKFVTNGKFYLIALIDCKKRLNVYILQYCTLVQSLKYLFFTWRLPFMLLIIDFSSRLKKYMTTQSYR